MKVIFDLEEGAWALNYIYGIGTDNKGLISVIGNAFDNPELTFERGKDTMKNMELKDTVQMMSSADYKMRFRGEYYQTVIRYKKLKAMLERWDKGELNFVPTCPRSTYNMQIDAMVNYIAVLEARAVMEGIELVL